MRKRTKFIAASLSALVIMSGVGIGSSIPVSGVTKVNYQFIVNEKKLDLPSYLTVMSKDNSTYVPVRFLSENMGLDVEYKPGTVKITSEKFNEAQNEEIKREVEKLNAEIKSLKEENDRLKSRISDYDKQVFYKELPAFAESGDGLKANLISVYKPDDRLEFYVQLENSNTSKSFIVDPFKTELVVDGKTYEATIDTNANLNSTLGYATSSTNPSTRNGRIYFEGLDTAKIKGTLIFKYTDGSREEKIMQLSFSNPR